MLPISTYIQMGKAGAQKGNEAFGKSAGLALSGIQLLRAAREKRQASSAGPPLEDTAQAGLLAELDQKRKAINTGAEFQTGIDRIGGNTAAADEAITQNTGGDVSGTIAGILGAENQANKGVGSVLAAGQNNEKYYTGAFSDLTNRMAQRKMELQLANKAQLMAQWATDKQNGMSNLLGALPGNKSKGTAGAGLATGTNANGMFSSVLGNTTNSLINTQGSDYSGEGAAAAAKQSTMGDNSGMVSTIGQSNGGIPVADNAMGNAAPSVLSAYSFGK
jgi:hypothetical protein